MWFYMGGGWFFRWEEGHTLHFRQLSADVIAEHPAAMIKAEGTLDGGLVVYLLEQLTGRARTEVLTFLNLPQPGR